MFDRRIFAVTAKSLLNMRRPDDVEFDFQIGYDCAHARTNMAEAAKAKGAEWLLMVDSDIVVPGDALELLLSDGVDVCMGYYPRHGRTDGALPFFELGTSGYRTHIFADEVKQLRDDGTNLLQVKGGGLGCTLVRTDVFGRIKYPWFDWVTYKDGHGSLSEDLYFCRELEKAGIPMYLDTRVSCGHIWAKEHWA